MWNENGLMIFWVMQQFFFTNRDAKQAVSLEQTEKEKGHDSFLFMPNFLIYLFNPEWEVTM